MYNQNEQNPVMRTVKEMTTAPLFLVGAIGYSVYVLFELLGGIMGNSGFGSLLNNLYAMGGGYSFDYAYMQAYISAFNGIRVMSVVITTIPAILIAAGIWISFVSAKSDNQPGISVTGLTIIRVITIIQLVFVCIGLVLLEIVCIVVMIGANAAMDYYSSGASIGFVMIFVMILIAAVSAIWIVYYLKLGKTLKAMRETVRTGIADAQISRYVEIICYIAGGIAVISALTSLVGVSVYEFLANAGLATANIGFAVFLRKYRGNMEMLLQDPVQQSYQQSYQQPAPQPYQQPYQESVQQSYQQSYQEPAPQPYQQSYQEPVQQPYQQSYQESVQQPYQQSYQEPAPQPYQQPYQEPAPQPYQQSYQEPAPQSYQQPTYGQENETTVLPYYNETSVLSGQFMSGGKMQLVRMTRQKTGETICISKPSFWIGKDAANVDYCITDNTAVSRRHALVTIQNENCYVRDNHSTNRLFVNGQAVQPDVDVLLSDGDRVRMGDEEFVVSIG